MELPNNSSETKKEWSWGNDEELHPLFMEQLPEDWEGFSDLAALKHIDDEGSLEDRAESEKERGNNQVKLKSFLSYQRAIDHYTNTLKFKCSNQKLNALCYSNRAAMNMLLGNYRRVIEDCNASLKLDISNLKAYYRAARACKSLDRLLEGKEYCLKGLKQENENQDMKKLLDEIEKLISKKEELKKKKQEEHVEKLVQYSEKLEVVNAAFAKRGIVMGNALFDLQNQYETHVRLDDQKDELHWPVLLLYPEHNQSDFIKDFNENDTIGDHLAYVFPDGSVPDWDYERKYQLSRLEVYIEVGVTVPLQSAQQKDKKIQQKWIRVKHTTKLKQVLTHPDYVVPQFPVFYIMVAGSKFLDTFLNHEN